MAVVMFGIMYSQGKEEATEQLYFGKVLSVE